MILFRRWSLLRYSGAFFRTAIKWTTQCTTVLLAGGFLCFTLWHNRAAVTSYQTTFVLITLPLDWSWLDITDLLSFVFLFIHSSNVFVLPQKEKTLEICLPVLSVIPASRKGRAVSLRYKSSRVFWNTLSYCLLVFTYRMYIISVHYNKMLGKAGDTFGIKEGIDQLEAIS